MCWVEVDLKPSFAEVKLAVDIVRDWKLDWEGHQEGYEECEETGHADKPVGSKLPHPATHNNKEEPKDWEIAEKLIATNAINVLV